MILSAPATTGTRQMPDSVGIDHPGPANGEDRLQQRRGLAIAADPGSENHGIGLVQQGIQYDRCLHPVKSSIGTGRRLAHHQGGRTRRQSRHHAGRNHHGHQTAAAPGRRDPGQHRRTGIGGRTCQDDDMAKSPLVTGGRPHRHDGGRHIGVDHLENRRNIFDQFPRDPNVDQAQPAAVGPSCIRKQSRFPQADDRCRHRRDDATFGIAGIRRQP